MALLARLSEPALVERARAREAGAFEELVGRTGDKLCRVARRIVRNESDAQEVLQDSYLSAWRGMPTFEGRAQFSSWMHKIVVNAALVRLRTRTRHPEVAIRDLDPSELKEAVGIPRHAPLWSDNLPNRPDENMQSAELLQGVEVAVNLLPRHLRAIFLLRAVDGASTVDSAARLGLSIPAAKTRLQRARMALRKSLVDYVAC
jgi:RNA polymerase sigma-70 factor (ECF subfamily)